MEQRDPRMVNSCTHHQAGVWDYLDIGYIAVKSPSNCIIEFCNRSQKSASEVEPKALDDLCHAKIVGAPDIKVLRSAIAKRVGLYCVYC
jgi:hypothetical protein